MEKKLDSKVFVPESIASPVFLDFLANTAELIIITGEPGTGKTVAARFLHRNSPHENGNFVAPHIAAGSSELFESQLFGHVKGSFTGAGQTRMGAVQKAHNGTLFLDEIGTVNLDIQAKLLRFLESGEYSPVGTNDILVSNARVIVATNVDLNDQVKKGEFRKDLLHRIDCGYPLSLKPLRENPDNIRRLLDYFLEGITKEFSTEVWNVLFNHRWGGNIRELEAFASKLKSIITFLKSNKVTVCQTKLLIAGYVDKIIQGIEPDEICGELDNHAVLIDPVSKQVETTRGVNLSRDDTIKNFVLDDFLNKKQTLSSMDRECIIAFINRNYDLKIIKKKVDIKDRFKVLLILYFLKKFQGRRKNVAGVLKMSRSTLYRFLDKYQTIFTADSGICEKIRLPAADH